MVKKFQFSLPGLLCHRKSFSVNILSIVLKIGSVTGNCQGMKEKMSNRETFSHRETKEIILLYGICNSVIYIVYI